MSFPPRRPRRVWDNPKHARQNDLSLSGWIDDAAWITAMTDTEYWDALSDPLPVRELAPLFRVHEATIHRHLQSGTIPGYYIGRSWIVYKCEIRAWLATRRNIPTDQMIDDDPDPLADCPDELRMRDLMALFGKTKQTIRAWLEDGEIPGYRVNGRWVAYKTELRETLARTSNQRHH